MLTRQQMEDAIEVDFPAESICAYFDGEDLPEDIQTALDSAQGNARSEKKEIFIIIRVA